MFALLKEVFKFTKYFKNKNVCDLSTAELSSVVDLAVNISI